MRASAERVDPKFEFWDNPYHAQTILNFTLNAILETLPHNNNIEEIMVTMVWTYPEKERSISLSVYLPPSLPPIHPCPLPPMLCLSQ